MNDCNELNNENEDLKMKIAECAEISGSQFQSLNDSVIKSSVKYLKEHGILDKVLKALIEVGKIAAVTACTTYGGPVVGEICNVAIGFIADQVINK